jgi:hypothetical protein
MEDDLKVKLIIKVEYIIQFVITKRPENKIQKVQKYHLVNINTSPSPHKHTNHKIYCVMKVKLQSQRTLAPTPLPLPNNGNHQ